MNVKGNSVSIASGATTTSTANHTGFGTEDLDFGVRTRIFTIENTGLGTLTLTGTSRVVISGAHAADFKVKIQPNASTVAPNGSLTFVLSFNPSVIGLRTATVSIANDDADENPYTFTIQGTGMLVP